MAVALISAMVLTGLQAFANDHEHDDCDCIEYEYYDIPDDKIMQILNSILELPEESDMTRGNLLCIFGDHLKEKGAILKTEHNYYTTAPRCKLTTYHVEYCTRGGCDYYAITDVIITKKGCH